jgi:hypothetical protein
MKKPASIMKKPSSIMKKPSSMKPILQESCTETQYKTKDRHREHSKKYHQVLQEWLRQGKGTELAKQAATDAACKRVKSLYAA